MPYKLTWEPCGGIVYVFGRLTVPDVREYETAIYGNSRFDTLKYIIWNGLEITTLDLNKHSMVVSLVTALGSTHINPDLKLGFVLTKEMAQAKPLQYLYGFHSHFKTWDLKVCASEQEIRNWLSQINGKPAGPPEPPPFSPPPSAQ